MPRYDYFCTACRKRFDVILTYSEYGKVPVTCKHCGSDKVHRKIGRVRVMRSAGGRLEDMSDSDAMDRLEDDPKALGKMMREMSSEMGEDMGAEFNEVVSRLEAGHSPEEIEKDMPDVGGIGSEPPMGGMDDLGDE